MRRISAPRVELDYMNAMACVLVVLIHVLSYGISNADIASWQGAGIFFVWRAIAFVVPAFLFTGAVKMALALDDDKITVSGYLFYIAVRIRKIYLPYLLWATIYYAAFMWIHYVKGTPEDFFKQLLLGTISSQFYYVIIVMQFYLLLPLWSYVVKRISFPVAFGLSVFCMFFAQRFSAVLALYDLSGRYMDRVFFTYLPYWILGLYVGTHYDRFFKAAKANRTSVLLMALVAVACTVLTYIQRLLGTYIYDMDHFKLISDMLSIFLLLWLAIFIKERGGQLGHWLGQMNRASFFVYLSHCLFITLATHILSADGISKISIHLAVRVLAGYTIPLLLFFALQRAKRLWRM